MQRTHLALLVVTSMIVLAGCGGVDSGEKAEQLGEDTGQNISGTELGSSYLYEVKVTEKNQYGLVQTQPPFQMDSSLERANLIRRYQYLNDRNNVHHVYMMSNDGKVISYFVAQGKVSSVNSKLTNDQQIVARQDCLDTTHTQGEGACFKTVESPQMDGSYGTNGNAIFFFTTDGAYVEWNGKYVVSERPLSINTPVSLVQIDGLPESNSVEQSDNSTQTNSTAVNTTG